MAPKRRANQAKNAELARQAYQNVLEGTDGECACDQNAMLTEFVLLLLEEVEEREGDAPDNMWLLTLKKAWRSVKNSQTAVKTEQDLRKLPFIGPKMVQIVRESLWTLYPPEPISGNQPAASQTVENVEKASKQLSKKRSGSSTVDESGEISEKKKKSKKGEKKNEPKAKKTYCPNIGTSNYAFIIMLYKSWYEGEPHLTKKELMERAERSGLSNRPIFGQPPTNNIHQPNPKGYYDGWSSMKTLKNNDPPLVLIWSSPLKIRLTEEGVELGRKLHADAVSRRKLPPLPEKPHSAASLQLPSYIQFGSSNSQEAAVISRVQAPPDPPVATTEEVPMDFPDFQLPSSFQSSQLPSGFPSSQNDHLNDIIILDDSDNEQPNPIPQYIEQQKQNSQNMGNFSNAQIFQSSQNSLMENSFLEKKDGEQCLASRIINGKIKNNGNGNENGALNDCGKIKQGESNIGGVSSNLVSLPSSGSILNGEAGEKLRSRSGMSVSSYWALPYFKKGAEGSASLRLPPLSFGQKFSDRYEIRLILDNREQFSAYPGGAAHHSREDAAMGHLSRLQGMGILAEFRQIQQGDALWIAKEKGAPYSEFVLDWIVERKRVDDLINSIKSKRYEQQKYWMSRSGLENRMYLVEGDADYATNGQCARTACVSTEIFEGFEVIRTSNLHGTFNTYAKITESLIELYGPKTHTQNRQDSEPLLSYNDFNQKMAKMKKLTVRDVWGLMLTRVPGIGCDSAEAILKQYPTPISLFRAYKSVIQTATEIGKDPQKEAGNVLSKIPVSGLRKIGPASSKKVFKTLFCEGWEVLR